LRKFTLWNTGLLVRNSQPKCSSKINSPVLSEKKR